MNSPELRLAIMAIAVVMIWLVVRAFRACLAKPAPPDPWGPEVSAAIEQPDAMAVCPHCLCPHEPVRWFCPECGHGVGDYNNLNPYLYLFSLGEVLREGTSGRVRKSWLTVVGYLFLSVIEYAVLAPIYWFFFFRNLARQQKTPAAEDVPPVITRD